MIDLHCHLLPGIDDGAPDLATAMAMARIAVADGIVVAVCTPHVMPGVFDNTGGGIRAAAAALAGALSAHGIPLHLTTGADVHLAPNLGGDLMSGRIPTLAGSRYFLLEPPHHVVPPRLEEFAFRLLAAGWVPILTHPERLSWIESQYAIIRRLWVGGTLMQLTAGSLLGRFGRRARYWSERMLDEAMVHVMASDAHDTGARPPRLAAARDAVAGRLGEAAAHALVVTNPLRILENAAPFRLEPARAAAVRAAGGS